MKVNERGGQSKVFKGSRRAGEMYESTTKDQKGTVQNILNTHITHTSKTWTMGRMVKS